VRATFPIEIALKLSYTNIPFVGIALTAPCIKIGIRAFRFLSILFLDPSYFENQPPQKKRKNHRNPICLLCDAGLEPPQQRTTH